VRTEPRAWLGVGLASLLLITACGAQDIDANTKTLAPLPAGLAAPPDVADPPAEAIKTASGVAMMVVTSGSGVDHPAGDDCVVLSFTAWKRDGSLVSTSGRGGQSTVQCLSSAIPGIAEALRSMVAGEERHVWIPAELAFAAHVAHHGTKHVHEEPAPPPDLTVDVKLIRILKAPLPPADLTTPPRTASRTPLGVAIQVLVQGTGPKHPSMTSWVTLEYSGWTTDGKLFESTTISGHPATLLLGTALPGWREALPRMVTGEKVRLWIPAAEAYGDRPVERMVPAGNLVYDMELVAFQ